MKRIWNHRLVVTVRELVERYFDDQVGRASAELAYYLLFSLFPMLIFINATVSRFHFSPQELLKDLGVILPAQIIGLIDDYFRYINSLDARTLLYAGLVLTIFCIARSVNSVMRSLSNAYRLEKRGFVYYVTVVIIALLLLISIVLLLALLLISEKVLLSISRYIPLPLNLVGVWDKLRFIVAPAYLLAVVTAFYYVVAQRRYSFWKALPGGIFCVSAWFVASLGFSFYVNNMSNYSVLYGSLGAIMILMLWLYIVGMVLIMGAELNHVIAVQKTMKDRWKG